MYYTFITVGIVIFTLVISFITITIMFGLSHLFIKELSYGFKKVSKRFSQECKSIYT